MKLRLFLLAFLVPVLISCGEKPIPDPEPAEATITVISGDITLEVGKTAQINAVTNSTATIAFSTADAAVATVSATGEVTGVKAGNTTITLKVDAVENMFTAAETTVKVTVTASDTPSEDPYADAAPELKDGDVVLSTDANVEKFLTDVHYNTHDYSSTELLTWAKANDVSVCPGNSDRAQSYSIRWTPEPNGGDVTVTVSEPTRDWVYTANAEVGYVDITNLLPNTHYTYKAVSGSKVLAQGAFDVTGKVHQLHIKTMVRNVRDLGGWKTTDGKTVKYRYVYRGGRLESSKVSKKGKTALKTEGIKAQLDLRGHTSSGSQEYMNREESILYSIWGDEFAFCSPSIEEGYAQMLRDDKEKTRQCMQFIMDCVDQDKPVYFHCSLGRDRTGTIAMLTLGILGVPEGDISQEYELTQFAPHGYATSEGEHTKMTRLADYDGAANVIWGYAGGGSFQDGVNAYLLEIGISQADIDKFKAKMIQ